MTEQEKINEAAKAYATDGDFQEWKKLLPQGETKYSECQRHFKAGASYYASEIIPGMLEKFSEWIRTFEALERQNGQWVIESQLSDKQIVKAFIEDIKQKDNANETNKT